MSKRATLSGQAVGQLVLQCCESAAVNKM
jgi:hypothetical protein